MIEFLTKNPYSIISRCMYSNCKEIVYTLFKKKSDIQLGDQKDIVRNIH